MRAAYADPPYPGHASRHYRRHPDYQGEVDHRALLVELQSYDGWVLHTASTTLAGVLATAAEEGVDGFRIMSWVKPWATFRRGVPVAYAWEPLLTPEDELVDLYPGSGAVARTWESWRREGGSSHQLTW